MYIEDTDATVPIPVPEGLAYLPFQRGGIAFGMARPAVLFGDEMGLGKTIQAVGVINADESIRHVLVLCPASLRINWSRELRKWLTRPLTIGVANGDECRPDFFDILVCNYDIADRHSALLRSRKWDLVILDEAHYLKNPKAKRTVAVVGATSQSDSGYIAPLAARRRIALTGTPIPNRPIEVFPILNWLDPATFPSFFPFALRYCNAHKVDAGRNGMVWDFSGASNLPELQNKMRGSVMVRRLKADVLKDLPPKVRSLVEIPQNGCASVVAAENKAWQGHEAEVERLTVQAQLAKAEENPETYAQAVARLRAASAAAFTEMSELRHKTAMAKVPYVAEHVLNAATEHKVVVFAHHKDVIAALLEALRKAGVPAVRVTGEDSMEARQGAVDRFQTDPSCMVFVGNIQAAGVGLTLTAAAHVVFAELDWVPGNVTQAEDRCHRLGQHASVHVEHIVIDGSMDARMARTLIAKQRVADAALDTVQNGGRGRESHRSSLAEPISPAEPSAIHPESHDSIGELAAKLTPELIAAVHSALQRLAEVCDFANKLDGAGFNRYDARIGHELAERVNLTPRQAVLGYLIARKYRKQLGDTLPDMKGTR